MPSVFIMNERARMAFFHRERDDFLADRGGPVDIVRTRPPATGMIGKIFQALPPFLAGDRALRELAAAMAEVEGGGANAAPSRIPAGFTFFEQF
ncbi:MAG: hypothetical protein AAF677_10920, partial [Pseudomonadota bacterium]